MNGVHDMGGMDGLRQGRARAERADVPRRMGAPRAGDGACDGRRRRAQHRHVALLPRDDAAARLSRQVPITRYGSLGLEDAAGRQGLHRPARKSPPAMRCSRRSRSSTASSPRRCRAPHGARQIRPTRGAGAGEVQAGRPRAREEHPSRRRTPGCRAMCAAMSAWSSATTAATYFPIGLRLEPARTRNGSTPWCSTAASCGARTPIPTLEVSIDAFEPYLEPA